MRLGSIISETLRNIASGTAHALAMFLAVLFAGTLLGGYEAMSVMRLETEAVVRIRAFADVKTVVGGNVDGLACDRLSDHGDPSFISGAMRSGPQVVPLATNGIELSSYEVTAGMIRLITAEDPQEVPDSSGVWVSSDVSHDFGLVKGSRMQTNHGTVTVAGVFDWPNDGRDMRYGTGGLEGRRVPGRRGKAVAAKRPDGRAAVVHRHEEPEIGDASRCDRS